MISISDIYIYIYLLLYVYYMWYMFSQLKEYLRIFLFLLMF